MINDINNFEYFAFISYKREDEKWAKWLQKKLESYSLPTSIRKDNPNLPSKIRPIFRDATDLGGAYLTQEIQKGLNDSKFLIVICSPRAAKSPWVSKEVQHFIDQGRAENIIPFIVDGIPFSPNSEEECFPAPLKSLKGDSELLAINVNEMGKNAALIKVIARMFNIRFDSLWRRYERNKLRRRLAIGISIILAILIALATYAYVLTQQREVDRAQSAQHIQHLYNEYLTCENTFNKKQYMQSFNASKHIMLNEKNIPDTLYSKFEYILRMSYAALQSDTLKVINRHKAEFPAMDWGDMPVRFNQDASKVWIGCSGFTEIETATGKCLKRGSFWPSKFVINNNKLYTFDDYEICVYNAETLEKMKSYDLSSDSGYTQMMISPSADGRRFITEDSNSRDYNVYDTETGKIIRTYDKKYGSPSINHNGSLIAFTENERLKLFDIDTNREVTDIENYYAADLQFDESGKWLLMYMKASNGVHIFNPETKESYHIYDITDFWGSSYNFDGNSYGNKYIVSDDNRYIAIGPVIYEMPTGELFKRLEYADDAMGLKILPEASKVFQINVDQEIVEYSRSGKPMFDYENINFLELLNNDPTPNKYSTKDTGYGSFIIENKSGKKIGEIKGIDGDIYHLSISPDERYVIISSLAIPTSLYDLSTGTLVQKFPFNTGDGYDGFGVFDKDGYLYFAGISTVFKYKLLTVEELLKINID